MNVMSSDAYSADWVMYKTKSLTIVGDYTVAKHKHQTSHPGDCRIRCGLVEGFKCYDTFSRFNSVIRLFYIGPMVGWRV